MDNNNNKTERETDRQTDRQRQRETETERVKRERNRYSHSFSNTCDKSAVSLFEIGVQCSAKTINTQQNTCSGELIHHDHIQDGRFGVAQTPS